MTTYQVSLKEAIYSLSDALDLVGVTHIHHGKRVAFIALECAILAGWPKEQTDRLFQAAILHDCGVSRTQVHARLAQLEWEHESEHCTVGAALLGHSPLLADLAEAVRYHHSHWEELEHQDLPDAIKSASNLIYLADRVDILVLTHKGMQGNILLVKDEICGLIAQRTGTWFNPALVEVFLQVAQSEAFWFSLEAEYINTYASTWLADQDPRTLDFEELKGLVQVFSKIVDAKSPFTREHSEGVACLARYIGQLLGLPTRSLETLELAGLLHDLGKLRVPDELLEKPSKLSDEEYLLVQRHSFDTFTILRRIKGLEEVARLASRHHERLDGSGYPYHHRAEEIPIEGRIIAVSDVFQALAQKRPYREPLAPPAILELLEAQAALGKLDTQVVRLVQDNLAACWEHALVR